jgi:hypothetical protein
MTMRIDGKEVGRVGLGTSPLAFSGRSVDDGVEVTLAALDSGVRLIDAALAYTRPGIESFAEAEPFGITATIVNPRFFRTHLLSQESANYASPSIWASPRSVETSPLRRGDVGDTS